MAGTKVEPEFVAVKNEVHFPELNSDHMKMEPLDYKGDPVQVKNEFEDESVEDSYFGSETDLKESEIKLKEDNKVIKFIDDVYDEMEEDSGESGNESGQSHSSKRKRNPDTWKENKRKKARNSGQEYVTTSGKVKPAKVRVDIDCCKTAWCDYKLISVRERDNIFTNFYKMGDYNLQNVYLFDLIRVVPVKRHYVKEKNPEDSRRHLSFEYFIKSDEKNMNIRVCSSAFLSLHGISKKRTELLKVVPNGKRRVPAFLPKIDRRGRHKTRPHAYTKEAIERAQEHIRLFPKYVSDECLSKNLDKQYILSANSIEEMYSMYVEQCNETGNTPIKLHKYRDIFNKDFKLVFKFPHN